MKTTKAYLAGLGTAGILIGSVLLVMFLGSGVAAFSGTPDPGATEPLDRVVVEDEALAAGAREARGADAARRAGGRAGGDALARRPAPRPPSPSRTEPPPASLPASVSPTAAGGGPAEGGAPGARAPRHHTPGADDGPPAVPDTVGGVTETVDGVLPPAPTAPPAIPRALSIDHHAGPHAVLPPTSRAPVTPPAAGRGG